jgi:DNA-binding MarR family transcriptional regulator
MNESKIGPDELKRIADIDLAIHSPARMKILAFLSVVESADFTFLMNQTGLTRGNLSSHMSRLEEVGYVSIKKEFVDRVPRTLISLTDEGRSAILTYRENMRQVLDELLAS